MNTDFECALLNNSLTQLQSVAKSDLHNHAGRGGTIQYIANWAHANIEPPSGKFSSLSDIQNWFVDNIKIYCTGTVGYLKRIEAAFIQANTDCLEVLALSFGIGEIDSLNGMDSFMRHIDELHRQYAPHTFFLPELTLARESNVETVYARLDEIFDYGWFKSIDICNNELAQDIKNFNKIYRLAKSNGLRLKAHVGEFGTADDVMEAVEALELSQVHHGIAAVRSIKVMKYLADNKIRLNICPTSNIMLGLVNEL